MNIYHGTTSKKADKINQNGFNLNYGRFGTGVYFSTVKKECLGFGNILITRNIPSKLIKTIKYTDLAKMYSYLNIEEEEGCTELETYIKSLDSIKGVRILYEDGTDEICIYDNKILN